MCTSAALAAVSARLGLGVEKCSVMFRFHLDLAALYIHSAGVKRAGRQGLNAVRIGGLSLDQVHRQLCMKVGSLEPD